MKKTIITILFVSVILYMLGMMIFHPYKTNAAGVILTPIDNTILCCISGYEECCARDCQDRYCLSGDPNCLIDNWDYIQICVNRCLRDTGALCYDLGYNN